MIHHAVNKIRAGYFNTALITDKGHLLLQGMNNCAQLTLPMEISKQLDFFPDFMKIDSLNDYFVKDVAFSSATVHALCEHKLTGRVKLFGWGHNTFKQLGEEDEKLVSYEPIDMTSIFVEQKGIEHTQDVIFDDDDEII